MIKHSFLLFVLLLAACSAPRFVADTEKVPFRELLDSIISDQNKLHSLTGKARISVESEDFNGNFFAGVCYRKHDSLRITVKGPFVLQAGSLFIGKSRFVFLNRFSNQFMSGEVNDFSDRFFLQFPLKLSELIDIFTATVRFGDMKIEAYRIVDDQFYIKATDMATTYDIRIDPKSGRVSEIVYRQGDTETLRCNYSEFQRQGDIYFPRKIKVVRPVEKQGVAIYYVETQINQPLDPEVFNIEIPDGVEQLNLQAGAAN